MRLNGGFQRLFSPFLAISICLVLAQSPFFPWISDTYLDLLFNIRGTRATSQSIIIVGVDEPSLQKHGPWPFPRETHGQLLQKVKEAKAIGFDLIFTHTDLGDAFLKDVIESGPPVSVAVASNYQGQLLRPPSSLYESVQLGHIETQLGDDGVVRRVLLTKWGLPVLAKTMLQGEHSTTSGEHMESSRTINFYGPEFTFLYISYEDVLAGVYEPGFFKNRYVFVGSKALALGDVHITPFSKYHPSPGVEIQATILNNLIDDNFIKRLSKTSIVISLSVIVLGFLFWPITSEAKNLAYGFSLLIGLQWTAIFLFEHNYFLNITLPILVLVTSYLLHLLSQWISITAKLIIEIRQLDRRLEEGIDTVFRSLPASLNTSSNLNKKVSFTGGLHRHIQSIHQGIQALSLQGSFINHLLSKETPPIILWQKNTGIIVLANNGFNELWETHIAPEKSLPSLQEFFVLIEDKVVSDKSRIVDYRKALNEQEREDLVVDIGILSQGRKLYNRVLVHEVKSEILGFSGILASFTDVTEIRELERLKGEVMNIVSHELKLPLTTILGYGEILSEALQGPQKTYAQEICDQSKRLAKMIEDFLDIARIESGKYAINSYPFDLLSVIHDAASAVKHFAQQKSITIVYNLPAKTTPLLGDEALITQAVINLLDNAVKFSPTASKVTLELIEELNNFTLRVSDEGPGIKESEQNRVFEKFIRGRGKIKESGFGLGLSFVRQVVDGHGGNIQVTNSEQGGARFTLQLPKN